MVGTIIFLLNGLPGLAVTGIGVARQRMSRYKRSDAVFRDEP
jgi:hypothetical protein